MIDLSAFWKSMDEELMCVFLCTVLLHRRLDQ
jgi:hypothetical protein